VKYFTDYVLLIHSAGFGCPLFLSEGRLNPYQSIFFQMNSHCNPS